METVHRIWHVVWRSAIAALALALLVGIFIFFPRSTSGTRVPSVEGGLASAAEYRNNAGDYDRAMLIALADMPMVSHKQSSGERRRGSEIQLTRAVLNNRLLGAFRPRRSALSFATLDSSGEKILVGAENGTVRIWDGATGRWTQPFRGHTQAVTFADFSQDRRVVVTASSDNTVRLWNTNTGALIQPPIELESAPTRTIFDRRSKYLLITSGDGAAALWQETPDRAYAMLRAYRAHRQPIIYAEFNWEGTYFVTISQDRTAKLWSVASSSGRPVLDYAGHSDAVNHAAFSLQGNRIATASDDGTARLWSTNNDLALAIYRGHEGPVNTVAFSADGERIVTASNDGTARLWSVSDPKQTPVVLRGHDGPVTHASFGRRDRYLLTASADRTVRLWDAKTFRLLAVLKGHQGEIRRVATGIHTDHILTASADGSARLWRTIDTQTLDHGSPILRAAVNADGDIIATGGEDGTLGLWSTSGGPPMQQPKLHDDPISHVAFHPKANQVITISRGKGAKLWDMTTKQVVVEMGQLVSKPIVAEFKKDGSELLAASEDGTVTVWTTSPWKSTETYPPDGQNREPLTQAHFVDGGARFVTLSADGVARLWTRGRREAPVTLNTGDTAVTALAVNETGEVILTATQTGVLQIWNARTGAALGKSITEHGGPIRYAAFDREGERIVTASDDQTALIWTGEGGLRQVLWGHEGAVTQARFNKMGDQILTRSSNNIIRLWDAASGKLLARMPGHGKTITFSAFSTDDRQILTASLDGTARLWNISAARQSMVTLIKKACERWPDGFLPVGQRDLSPVEAFRFLGSLSHPRRQPCLGRDRLDGNEAL